MPLRDAEQGVALADRDYTPNRRVPMRRVAQELVVDALAGVV
jgi:hypothetical protein